MKVVISKIHLKDFMNAIIKRSFIVSLRIHMYFLYVSLHFLYPIYFCFIRWAAWQWSVTWWDVEILPSPHRDRGYTHCLHIQRHSDCVRLVSVSDGQILLLFWIFLQWRVNQQCPLQTIWRDLFLLYQVTNDHKIVKPCH